MDTLVNFFHLLAAAVWIGGSIFIKLVLNPSMTEISPSDRGKFQGMIGKRFSIAAWTSIIILIITGVLKTPSDMYFDTSSDMGVFLTIKLISVIAVIIIGLIIALKFVPAIRAGAPKPGERPSDEFMRNTKRLDIFAAVNTVLGVLILLWASLLW